VSYVVANIRMSELHMHWLAPSSHIGNILVAGQSQIAKFATHVLYRSVHATSSTLDANEAEIRPKMRNCFQLYKFAVHDFKSSDKK